MLVRVLKDGDAVAGEKETVSAARTSSFTGGMMCFLGYLHALGEGHGNPLQYSWLENPMGIDNISMASYTGNVIITGDEGMDTLALAKSLVKEIQNTDSNFSGKTAKISGGSLNKKDISETLDKLSGGALIVQNACAMTNTTVQKLHRTLEQEERGIIVILIDGKKTMNRFLKSNPELKETFTVRIDIAAMDNDALVKHGVEYAKELEYSIDDLGVLALHTRIAEMQTSDHAVNINEVKEIVDEAIRHANRKTLGHFFDIIVAKRYDDEDMIILRENDFI